MPSSTNPSGADFINPRRKYRPAVLRAVKQLRRDKPWRGTNEERREKFVRCLEALAAAYSIPAPVLFTATEHTGLSEDVMFLSRFSVVTFLHLFAAAAFPGCSAVKPFAWSLTLFARCFPRSFAGCRFNGYALERAPQESEGAS